MNPTRTLSASEALSRLQNLCSTREKCSGDIMDKLRQWGLNEPDKSIILEKLIKDRYVDDKRFAGFFARDKQNINKWGKEKIRFALIHKGLKRETIDEALSSLTEDNFETVLRELLTRKLKDLSKYEPYERKNRLVRFAIQRGYDYDLTLRIIAELLKV